MTRKNSFDFIRLIAAIVVILSHSFALTGHKEPSLGGITIGSIAVWVFFILSGYLISKSWDQYPRFNVFFAKRLLRIIPGLFVAVVSTILVIGLFFTSLPFLSYISNQETINYLNNIFMYNTTYTLPGVFTDNTYPGAVNGSIWTLAYEFTMYLAVAIIGVMKIYKKISPVLMWSSLLFLVLLLVTLNSSHSTISIFYLEIGQLLTLGLMFFSGIMMHKYNKNIKLNNLAGVFSLIIFIGLSILIPKATPLLAAVFLTYGLFSLGRYEGLSSVSRWGDFSYGLYIYAFPIQQMIASATQTLNPWKMFILSTMLTLIVAATSWYFIESKSLKWKDKINTKKYPIVQADEAW